MPTSLVKKFKNRLDTNPISLEKLSNIILKQKKENFGPKVETAHKALKQVKKTMHFKPFLDVFSILQIHILHLKTQL